MQITLSGAAYKLLNPYVRGKQRFMQRLRFKLPPPNLLITFEAAGRHLSFTQAASELNVSRVAVSQQIKALETFLGTPLFQRLHRSIRLTQTGARYHLEISGSLERILRATIEISQRGTGNTVNIRATPGFMTYWLLPNISEFRALHPNIELRFIVSDANIGFDDNIDIAIQYGDAPVKDAKSEFLVRQSISPTCGAHYLGSGVETITPVDLLQLTLIHLEGPYQQTRWSTWFRAQGIGMENPRAGITVNSYTNLVQAVLDGQGFALLGPPLIERFLANKTLVQPVTAPPTPCEAFHLVMPQASAQSPACTAFFEWIRQSFGALVPTRMEELSNTTLSH